MSFYAAITGEVQYPNRESFNEMVGNLKEWGWIDKDGYFVDECNHRISENPDVDSENLVISIPLYHYRNLSRVDFFTPGAKGEVIGTSTDGCFEGWVIKDGNETGYNLEQWAAENMDGDDRFPPDPDDFENLCEWQQQIEQEFFDEFS